MFLMCACTRARALNDAINYAQKGCAMQIRGITVVGFDDKLHLGAAM